MVAVLRITVSPRGGAAAVRLRNGVDRLTAEDPALTATFDEHGSAILGALTETHLEVALDRLRREFGVDAWVTIPRVAYKETVTRPGAGEGHLQDVDEGRERYAHVKLRVSPAGPGDGLVIRDALDESTVPGRFVPAVHRGIEDASRHGLLAGHPMDDLIVDVYDGSHDATRSSAPAFRTAAAIAFTDAVANAAPVVLEPIMRVEIGLADEWSAQVIADLVARRGQILDARDSGGRHIIRAIVPLSELFGFPHALREQTRGRAAYAVEFDTYTPVAVDPPDPGDDRSSFVPAPRTPRPSLKPGCFSVSEPDETLH